MNQPTRVDLYLFIVLIFCFDNLLQYLSERPHQQTLIQSILQMPEYRGQLLIFRANQSRPINNFSFFNQKPKVQQSTRHYNQLSVSMQKSQFEPSLCYKESTQDAKSESIPALISNLSLEDKKQSILKTQQQIVCNHHSKTQLRLKRHSYQKKSKRIEKNEEGNNHQRLKRSYKRRKDPNKKQNYKKQFLQESRKNRELQQQIQRLRSKMECCVQCRYSAFKKETDIKIDGYRPNYEEEMKKVAGSLNESRGSMGSLEFQNVDFQAPIMYAKQMDDKAWVYIGTLMIVMGSKCLQVDGTINVFRILKQSVDTLRREVEKSVPNITLDFYLTQQQMKQCNIMQDIGFDPFTEKIGGDTGLALEGVKIQSVQQFELLYDNKLTYNIKYEALLGAMEYLRQNSWVTF